MPIDLWLAYVAACTVILSIPGPTILLVLSYSLAEGSRANLPAITGVALGDALALTLSLAGLGALLSASAFWFTLVKLIGGGYLIYLGLKMILSKRAVTDLQTVHSQRDRRKILISCFLVTAMNPKSIVFFIALLPQFISPQHAIGPQLWILGLTFLFLAILACTGYAVFASRLRQWLWQPLAQRAFNLVGGSLLCTAGIWALMARRVSD